MDVSICFVFEIILFYFLFEIILNLKKCFDHKTYVYLPFFIDYCLCFHIFPQKSNQEFWDLCNKDFK